MRVLDYRRCMTLDELELIRNRIQRAFNSVRADASSVFHTSYHAPSTDFVTNLTVFGIQSPDQLEDNFLNLFIWIWSLKDHLKACFETNGLNGRTIEEAVNRCPALTYVADIANRAKHGVLRASRSSVCAKLVDIGFEAPQTSIARIVVEGPIVTVYLKEIQNVEIQANIATSTGARFDALSTLREAMDYWECNVLPRLPHKLAKPNGNG